MHTEAYIRHFTTQKPGLKNRSGWKYFTLFIFAMLVVLAFLLGNYLGTVKIGIPDIIRVIFNDDGSPERSIIWDIRLPRLIVAALVGINLALSGAILQGVMSNPLADPTIIGVSAGAGLAGIIILILFPQHQLMVPMAAFVGAMGAAVLIYILAWKGGIQPLRIILAGVAVAAFLGAGISALMVLFSDRVHGAILFMNGSLSARSWPDVFTILPYSVLGAVIAVFMAERLNILVLGDDTARSLGLNVEATRMGLTAVAALLAASAVSVVGLLGFVGLIIPHATRLLLGTNHRVLFPGAMLLGAAVVMLSDTFARTAFSPTEIPVGIVMAILGVPFFLYLLRR
ncbi:MAG: iron ABC transporter permease [Dehalococcoidales bacterium]|nr:iron ABC transporter permease [Dehalococcoidales bacterium]